MGYRPGAIPRNPADLASFLDRELYRIAQTTEEMVTSARVMLLAGPTWSAGAGSPEGVVTAPKGSLYSRTDGGASTCLYVKESGTGSAGWVAK